MDHQRTMNNLAFVGPYILYRRSVSVKKEEDDHPIIGFRIQSIIQFTTHKQNINIRHSNRTQPSNIWAFYIVLWNIEVLIIPAVYSLPIISLSLFVRPQFNRIYFIHFLFC